MPFPKPYQNEVKQDEGMMEYVPFDKLDIGARASGMPKSVSEGPKKLEHVGSSASGRGGK